MKTLSDAIEINGWAISEDDHKLFVSYKYKGIQMPDAELSRQRICRCLQFLRVIDYFDNKDIFILGFGSSDYVTWLKKHLEVNSALILNVLIFHCLKPYNNVK